ncbi:MAG TPA: hypothetical protein VGW33_02620 [Terriglobia bacterium]|nr:hypothetical protein [Terriglobia bacterium]
MKARVSNQPATIYSQPDSSAPPITQVPVGGIVEVGGVKTQGGRKWVAATLSDGRRGYLAGDAKVIFMRRATLLQDEVAAYSQPSTSSGVKARYQKSATLYLGEKVTEDGKAWARVLDSAGNEGFVDGQTRIKVVPEATKAAGRKNMLRGGLWCVGGIVVTVATYSAAASGGGTYFVAWGAILFGGIQFFKGMYQFLTASA